MGGFGSLFSLRGTHEFFAGGACPVFDFVPTQACEQLLASGVLLFRQGPEGIGVFYDSGRQEALPDEAHFDFRVYCRDTDFYTYTDAPLLDAGQVLYFDSARADAGGRLSRDDYVSRADLCPPTQLPAGFSQRGRPPLFLARVSAGARNLEARAYCVPFRARQTAWEYYVSGKGVVGTGLYVAAAGGEEAFDYQGEVGLPNGRPASLYRSKTLLPLLRDQTVQFSLRERFNGRIVIKKLPVPSTRSLAKENVGGGEVLTSQMFISL